LLALGSVSLCSGNLSRAFRLRRRGAQRSLGGGDVATTSAKLADHVLIHSCGGTSYRCFDLSGQVAQPASHTRNLLGGATRLGSYALK